MPLAAIVKASGAAVAGSDRSLDAGRTPAKFDHLTAQGVRLFPQDGSGVTSPDMVLVASAAIEDSVPDVAAARQLGCRRISRAGLLAELFNAASARVAVGGTSGKSTVTGMIGWILHATGRHPTIMNGAVMTNFASADAPFASALVGPPGGPFVSEVDESDGSIALYEPTVAVLNNISLDHKPMDELHHLFAQFVGRAAVAVINLDDAEAAIVAREAAHHRLIGFGIEQEGAAIVGHDLIETPAGVRFAVTDRTTGETCPVALQLIGRHNASNALAAIAAARGLGIALSEAADALGGFTGLKRRLEVVGTAGGVTVMDDFGHNPDKVAATLSALHAFPGRLLLFFQPHGYGPLKQMGRELAASFASAMGRDDRLLVSDPAYFGGTTDRSVGSDDLVARISAEGGSAEHIAERDACARRLVELAAPGDRIVVMGARDDSLSTFAAELVDMLSRVKPVPEGL